MSAAEPVSPRPPVLVADVTRGRVRLVVTGRGGGVPGSRFGGGNLGAGVGDDPAAVTATRLALGRALGLAGAPAFISQVHGRAVVDVSDAGSGGSPAGPSGPAASGADTVDAPRADAALVVGAGAAAVTVADCRPLLLADAGRGVAAAVHVGRRGLVLGIAAAAVAAMRSRGARHIHALLGPGICGGCYEVPPGMRDEVDAVVPGSAALTRWGTASVDIAAGVRGQLRDLGVVDVETVARCTYEDKQLFSHRRDASTGRFAGVVVVR